VTMVDSPLGAEGAVMSGWDEHKLSPYIYNTIITTLKAYYTILNDVYNVKRLGCQ